MQVYKFSVKVEDGIQIPPTSYLTSHLYLLMLNVIPHFVSIVWMVLDYNTISVLSLGEFVSITFHTQPKCLCHLY